MIIGIADRVIAYALRIILNRFRLIDIICAVVSKFDDEVIDKLDYESIEVLEAAVEQLFCRMGAIINDKG